MLVRPLRVERRIAGYKPGATYRITLGAYLRVSLGDVKYKYKMLKNVMARLPVLFICVLLHSAFKSYAKDTYHKLCSVIDFAHNYQ